MYSVKDILSASLLHIVMGIAHGKHQTIRGHTRKFIYVFLFREPGSSQSIETMKSGFVGFDTV
jgi:hypothetical protein